MLANVRFGAFSLQSHRESQGKLCFLITHTLDLTHILDRYNKKDILLYYIYVILY